METIVEKRGNFTVDSIQLVIDEIKNELSGSSLRKKVYVVAIECLENICKYCDVFVDDDMDESFLSKIIISRDEKDDYQIKTGNIIYNDEIESLKEKLDKVNKLSDDEIRTLYSQEARGIEIHDRGGAGLGTLEIAKRADGDLKYSFEKINAKLSYYTFIVKVCSNKSN